MIGQTVRDYTISEELGRGGMGIVYKASDTMLNRAVALKFMNSELFADDMARARFLREAQVGASLDHQNICTIYSIEENDEQPFIVMSYIEGHNLSEDIAAGPQPWPDIYNLFGQIVEGMRLAHRKGIIHRDIKPANIMISTEGVVKITDFGLAKFLGGESLTTSETTHGTAGYMAPERWKGAEPNQQSDIFSLGVVLYEMITGKHPFPGMYKDAVIYAILHTQPMALETYRDDVPAGFQQIIERALAKDPADRYADMDEVHADLERIQRGETPEPLPQPDAPYRLSAMPWARIAMAICLVMGVVMAIAGIQWLISKPPGEKPPVKLAILPFAIAGSDSQSVNYIDGFTEDLMMAFTAINDVRISSRDAVYAYKDSLLQDKDLGSRLGVEYLLKGSLQQRGNLLTVTTWMVDVRDGFQIWMDQSNTPIDGLINQKTAIVYNVADRLKIALSQEDSLQIGVPATRNSDAYQNYLRGLEFFQRRTQGDNAQAINFYREAIRADSSFAEAYARLAQAYFQRLLMRWVEPSEHLTVQQAYFSLARRAVELDDRSAFAHVIWGYINLSKDPDLALEALRRALALSPSSKEANQALAGIYSGNGAFNEVLSIANSLIDLEPNQSANYNLQGDAYRRLNRYEEALAAYRRATELTPGQPVLMGKLADTYADAGDYDQAEQVYEELIALNPASYYNYKLMGDFQTLWKRDYIAAARWYRQAIARAPVSNRARLYQDLGDLYIYADQPDSALYYYGRTPAAHRAYWLAAGHTGVADMDLILQWSQETMAVAPDSYLERYVMGLAYERQGNDRQARAWYDSSAVFLQARTNITGKNHILIAVTALSLAKSGKNQAALQMIETAINDATIEPTGLGYYLTGRVYALTGNIEQARAYFERAFRFTPYVIDLAKTDWEMNKWRQEPDINDLLERYN